MTRDLFELAGSVASTSAPGPDVDAAARAIYEFQQGCVNGTLSSLGEVRRDCCPPWENIHSDNRMYYRKAAQAALSAIFPEIERPDPYAYIRSLS